MTNLLVDQYKKISTFFYILILLYLVTVFSNLFFQWEGISIIVRVYLFIFSFQLVFIFSQIDLDYYRNIFIEKYGRNGVFFLFVSTRAIPLVVIYLSIVIFTFVFYLKSPLWPMRPFLNVLNGRFSNIIIYSLILMIILKIEKSLKVTIPLFLSISVLYFITYKIVYYFSPDGYPTTVLKIMNFAIVFFFMFTEFFYNRINMGKIIFITLILSLLLHFIVVGIYYSVYRYSTAGSYGQIKSSIILLKMGYSFPLKKLNEIMESRPKRSVIPDLIHFSRKYGKKIRLTHEKWDNLVKNSNFKRGKAIIGYLYANDIHVSFDSLSMFALRLSVISGDELLETESFRKYAANYFPRYRKRFFSDFSRGNIVFKMWAMKVIGESGDRSAIPWLIDRLTDIDREISLAAYDVLKKITGKDPAAEGKVKVNNPDVISAFRKMYRKRDRDR